VLAPNEQAPWLAMVPMHSFASHWLLSLTYKEQQRLSDAFFRGELDMQSGPSVLSRFGIGFVVMPVDSPARQYLGAALERARVGQFVIFEVPGAHMRPFPF
jgi:hypothetical protein